MEEPPLRVYPPNRTPVSPMGTPSYSSSSSSSNTPLLPLPKPNEVLQEMGTPQFLLKTFEMVEDPTTDPVVSWSRARNSFVVWDYCRLAADVLPKYFKHNNFCSFVRQLNTYGFRKVDPDRWEFASEGFLGGQKHLLKTIRRRRNPPKSLQQGRNDNFSFSSPSNSGLKSELESLKTDKAALTLEVAILRQHQQASEQELLSIEKRLKGTEKNLHLMLAFLAKLVKNRSFAEKLIMCNERKKPITGGGADPKGRPGEGHGVFPKKRRRLPCGESVEALKAETEIDTLLFRTPIQEGIEVDDAEGVLSHEMIMPREGVASEVVEGLVASNVGDDSFVQDLVKQMGDLGSKQ